MFSSKVVVWIYLFLFVVWQDCNLNVNIADHKLAACSHVWWRTVGTEWLVALTEGGQRLLQLREEQAKQWKLLSLFQSRKTVTAFNSKTAKQQIINRAYLKRKCIITTNKGFSWRSEMKQSAAIFSTLPTTTKPTLKWLILPKHAPLLVTTNIVNKK